MSDLLDHLKKFEEILLAFPEVRYAGDPILRQPTPPVSIEEGIRISERLGEILKRYRAITGYGRGLAAPQIGENKAVFVTFVDDNIHIFINPRIVEFSSATNFYRELCLSSGIMSADVERSEWIVMEWLNGNGEQMRQKCDGFLARLYQHEEAHIRGRLNLDDAIDGKIAFALFDPLKEQLRNSL